MRICNLHFFAPIWMAQPIVHSRRCSEAVSSLASGPRADSLPWFDSPLVQGASRPRYTDKSSNAATGPYWPKGARNKKRHNQLRTTLDAWAWRILNLESQVSSTIRKAGTSGTEEENTKKKRLRVIHWDAYALLWKVGQHFLLSKLEPNQYGWQSLLCETLSQTLQKHSFQKTYQNKFSSSWKLPNYFSCQQNTSRLPKLQTKQQKHKQGRKYLCHPLLLDKLCTRKTKSI